MFSRDLQELIDAVVVDGRLDSNEELALKKRAMKEGADFDEVMVYVNSKLQKMQMEEDKKTDRHEKERNGIICPHCSIEIPPLTHICPNCGYVISSSDLSGDKELHDLIGKINKAIVEVKTTQEQIEYEKAKAECEALLRNANLLYGENKKIQLLKSELEDEIQEKGAQLKKEDMLLTVKWAGLIALILVALGAIVYWGYQNFESIVCCGIAGFAGFMYYKAALKG